MSSRPKQFARWRVLIAQLAVLGMLLPSVAAPVARGATASARRSAAQDKVPSGGDADSVRATTATLTNGAGDGSVTVNVDSFGAFGASLGLPTSYDSTLPSVGPGETTAESAIYFSPLDEFLAGSGALNGTDPNPTPVDFSSTTATSAVSSFSQAGFDFTLTQTLGAASASGSTLTQDYSIKNTTAVGQSVTIVRVLNSALAFDGTANDAGKAAADGSVVAAIDSGGGTTPKASVEIGAGTPATFSIQQANVDVAGVTVPYTDAIRAANGIPATLANKVAGDTNGDLSTDVDYDVTLWVQQTYTVAPGATISFSTTTRFRDRPLASADLQVSIEDSPDPVAIRDGEDIQQITYTIHVHNAGPDIAPMVILTDVLPPGTGFVSFGGQGTAMLPDIGTAGTITVSVGAIAPDATANFSIIVDVLTTTPQVLTNTANAVDQTVGDPNLANNTAVATTTASEPRPDVTLVLTQARNPVAEDSLQVYSILVFNPGLGTAHDVVVTLTPPAGTTFVYAISSTGAGPVAQGNGSYIVDLGTLKQGSVALIEFAVHVVAAAGSTITNTVSVTTSSVDPDLSNNVATISATVELGAGRADLELGYEGTPNPVAVGNRVTYTFRVRNLGPDTASDVIFTHVTPIGTRLVSVATTQGTCSLPTGNVGAIRCDLGTITPVGGAADAVFVTVVLQVLPSAGTTLSSVADVSGTERDPNANNNRVITSTDVTGGGGSTNPRANLSVAVVADQGTFSESGLATYTFTIRNLGPDTATGVTFSTATPVGTTFVSSTSSQGTCTGPAVGAGGPVICTIGPLFSGGTTTVTLVVRVNASAGASVTVTGSVSSGVLDTDSSDNTASLTTQVGPINPPLIIRVKAVTHNASGAKTPFRLKIIGQHFQSNSMVFIGGQLWQKIRVDSDELIVVLGGHSLQLKFPRNVEVEIRVVNPDGSSDSTTFKRPRHG